MLVIKPTEDDPGRFILAGSFDISTADLLFDMVDPVVVEERDITLDLDGVVFIDSYGFGALVLAAVALQPNARLILIGLRGMVLDVVEQGRLDRVFSNVLIESG